MYFEIQQLFQEQYSLQLICLILIILLKNSDINILLFVSVKILIHVSDRYDYN